MPGIFVAWKTSAILEFQNICFQRGIHFLPVLKNIQMYLLYGWEPQAKKPRVLSFSYDSHTDLFSYLATLIHGDNLYSHWFKKPT